MVMSSRRSFPKSRSTNPFSTPRQPGSVMRTIGRVIIAVIVIAAVYLIVDFSGRVWAESYVADQVQRSLGLSAKPQVTFGGPFFLPQLVSGSLSSAKAEAEDFTSGNVSFVEVQLQLEDVGFSPGKLLFHDDSTIIARSGTGFVSMTADQLTDAFNAQGIPINIRFDADGVLRVSASRLPVSATISATIESGDLVLRPTNPLFSKISFALDLPEFVPGLTYEKITFDDELGVLEFSLKDAAFTVPAS
jgi:hypothetical protein